MLRTNLLVSGLRAFSANTAIAFTGLGCFNLINLSHRHFTKKAAWMRQASDKMPKSASGKAKAKLGGKSAVATSPEDAKSTSPVNSRPDGSVEIKILAKPGSKHNSITGLSEEGVGVQIAAPPVDGEANTELVKYLTKLLAVRKSDLTLDKGSKSRNKTVLVDSACGLSVEEVIEKLQNEKDS